MSDSGNHAGKRRLLADALTAAGTWLLRCSKSLAREVCESDESFTEEEDGAEEGRGNRKGAEVAKGREAGLILERKMTLVGSAILTTDYPDFD